MLLLVYLQRYTARLVSPKESGEQRNRICRPGLIHVWRSDVSNFNNSSNFRVSKVFTWRFSLEEVISDKGETSFTIPMTSDKEFKNRMAPEKNDSPHTESLLISCRASSGTKLYLIVGTSVTSWHYKFKVSTGQRHPRK